MKIKHKAYLFLAASLLILLGSFSYLYVLSFQLTDLRNELLQDENTIINLKSSRNHLLQSETANRGFLLSQDDWFLNNYQSSKHAYVEITNSLKQITSLDSFQHRRIGRLDSIGTKRIEHLDHLLNTYLAGDIQPVIWLVQQGEGKNLMDSFSHINESIVAYTQLKIDNKKAHLNWISNLEIVITIIVGIIASALLIALFIYFNKTQFKLANYNDLLETRNQELQHFSYIASHDLKEPLRMISGFLTLLEKKYKGKLDDKADEYIHYAVDGANRMQQMITGLLEFSRLGRSETQHEYVDFKQILNEVKNNLNTLIAEHEAEIYIDSDLPKLPAHKHEILRVFQNLINNAIKFKKKDTKPVIRISCNEKKAYWLFSIEDNGIGIPEEKQEQIFKLFQQVHLNDDEYTGSGLGLAISKKIIERHGGKIWVDSKEGKGSSFFFTIRRNKSRKYK